MKIGKSCPSCLKRLLYRVSDLLRVSEEYIAEFEELIDRNLKPDVTPPAVANRLLRAIKERLKIEDPFESVKFLELKRAMEAYEKIKDKTPDGLTEALKFSAIGNGSDFFLNGEFSSDGIHFFADMEKIEAGLSQSRSVLIIGDNISDFIFDLILIDYLENNDKKVHYLIREKPVQNDLSMVDVKKYQLTRFFKNFLSTGTDEVGLKKEDINGPLKEFWEGNSFIIAKGMGNYETLTEFAKRPITYVMKVKCEEVSRSTGYPMGTYLASYKEG
ncbi:MAG: ARMT1-like domain-containing protein [Deltaproteobacteria bacterium]|nr:ARMT1-like domain-containing protein [Deltaproteobacteria bacterium]